MLWLFPRQTAEQSSHARAPAEDVMSQADTLVFVFLFVVLCGFKHSLFILSAPAHGCLSLSPCHLTLLSLYSYECLQYLMEAKKAQQSLESTYKQLDSVSPLLELKTIDENIT